ncbi:MAG: hypothetical protein L0H84_17395 [Pseudonocardia sp.]|nr:hypothetical protein [Pseudonocardia sp.]
MADRATQWGRQVAGNPAVRVVGTSLGPMIARITEKARELLDRRRPVVAVTGLAGVGKTVLTFQLCAVKRDYRPVAGASVVVEQVSMRTGLTGVQFRVVPGGHGASRSRGFDELFHDKPVSGIVHVVANGFTTPRPDDLGRRPSTPPTIAEHRERQRQLEVEDLRDTAHHIATLVRRRSADPIWLIVAVVKTDLCAAADADPLEHYWRDPDSPFVQQLQKLRREVGERNLTLDIVTVSSVQQDFVLGAETVASRGSDAERDRSLDALAERIRQMSGHVA